MPPGKFDRMHARASRLLPVLVFAWVQAVLLLWWVAQWPGLLSPDSIRYVLHVTSGPWTADHSVLYDTAVLASLTLTRNVALLTALQTTLAALVVAYTVASLRVAGVRGRWAAVPAIILPLLPSFGAFVTTVWKDVPFALCEVLVAATTLRLFAQREGGGTYRQTPRRLLLALGAELLGLALFRNDGFVLILVIAVVLAVLMRGARIAVLAVSVVAIVASFLAQGVIYPAAGIQPAASSLSYGLFDADIALAYAGAPRTFTATDRALMASVAPLATWRRSDNCYNSDPLFHGKGFSARAADQHHIELLKLWQKVLVRTSVTVVLGRLCRGSVAWNVLPPPKDKANFGEVVSVVPANLYGRISLLPTDIGQNLRPQPLNSPLGDLGKTLRDETRKPAYQPVLWRGATWCYLAYLALLIGARRLRRWDLLAVGAPLLANQLTVLALNPAQLYRYMVGPIFLGILLLPLVSARRSVMPSPPRQDEPETAATAELTPAAASWSLSDRSRSC